MVAVNRTGKSKCFDKQRLRILRRISEQQRGEQAGGLKDGDVDCALALAQGFFVNFRENAYGGFQTPATVVTFQVQTAVRAAL